MDTVNISLTSNQVKLVDALTAKLSFANRSEFFRALLRVVERKPELVQTVDDFILQAPKTKNLNKVMASFKTTKKYNQKFLSSLEQGLKESGYFSE